MFFNLWIKGIFMLVIEDNAKKTIQGLSKLDYGQIDSVGKMVAQAMKAGNKLLAAGNGGSAADAQHLVGELVCKFLKDRKGYPAIALSTNTSVITAWANDISYDTAIARQIEALGKKGDVFIGITTSGNSKNIIEAFRKCREIGIKTVLLEGAKKGAAEAYADIAIKVGLDETPRIQECHIFIIHNLCYVIEEEMEKGQG
jgi:D-sedoheptulose 7-phosphate isomerase